MINSEITSLISSRINEMRVDVNSHIREAIEQALFEQVLPTIGETLSELGNSARNNLDSTSAERQRSPEVTPLKRTWESILKLGRNIHNQCHDPLPVGIFPVVGEYRNLKEGEDMAGPHNIT